MCHRPLGTSCARLILPREGHGGDGFESRYQFHGENDEMLQRSVRELGALALRVGLVLDFATEIHAAAQTSAKPVNITAERYHYDPTRFRVTFELPKLPGQLRRRVRKVAPAGLSLEQALAWARRSEREVLQELLLGGGAPQEDRPNPSRQPLQPRPARAKAKSTEPPMSSAALRDGPASTQVDGPPAPCRGRVSRGARSRPGCARCARRLRRPGQPLRAPQRSAPKDMTEVCAGAEAVIPGSVPDGC